MLAFVEERLDLGIDLGAAGGPEFSTTIVVRQSGYEQANINWSESRGRWELGERNVSKAKVLELQSFFRRRRGKAVGFRYKDWNDWQATDEVLTLTGAPTVQLTKTYNGSGDPYVRTIKKPVSGSVTVKRNGVTYAGVTLDTTTGVLTMPSDSSKTITAITKANPGKITSTAHGFSNGHKVYLAGIGGMTQLNGIVVTVTVVDANNFTVGIDTTNYTTYTSGGTAAKYAQGADVVTWSGDFDVPVRFDTDAFRAEFAAHDASSKDGLYYLSSLPVVEIRV